MPKGKRQSPQKRPGRAEKRGISRSEPAERWLYGAHAVLAALHNPARRCRQLLMTEDAARRLEREIAALPAAALTPVVTTRADIERRLSDAAVHQGIALEADPLPVLGLPAMIAGLGEQSAATLIALDQVSDPQNAGAVIRAAAAFGAAALLLTERHAPPITGALAKAAAGALEHVTIVRVGNLVSAIDTLKDSGFWCLGLDASAQEPLTGFDAAGYERLVVAVGAEGKGLRRLTREHCDILLRIPMAAGIESLNVASATAVTLFALRAAKIEADRGIGATVASPNTTP